MRKEEAKQRRKKKINSEINSEQFTKHILSTIVDACYFTISFVFFSSFDINILKNVHTFVSSIHSLDTSGTFKKILNNFDQRKNEEKPKMNRKKYTLAIKSKLNIPILIVFQFFVKFFFRI